MSHTLSHDSLIFYAVGIDLVETDRIRRSLEQFGEKFIKRVSSGAEIGDLKSPEVNLPVAVAGRFAAKEAVMKALGTFFDRGVRLKDIEIRQHKSQPPEVRLPERLWAELKGKKVLVSISSNERLAMAWAAIVNEA